MGAPLALRGRMARIDVESRPEANLVLWALCGPPPRGGKGVSRPRCLGTGWVSLPLMLLYVSGRPAPIRELPAGPHGGCSGWRSNRAWYLADGMGPLSMAWPSRRINQTFIIPVIGAGLARLHLGTAEPSVASLPQVGCLSESGI